MLLRVADLVTTHYMDEAEHSCDRVALMHRGRIRVMGSPRELIAGLDRDGATSLDDVFRAYTGDDWSETPEGFRHVKQTRGTGARLG
jgi:ABC-2 type transport system ATP-binding protein